VAWFIGQSAVMIVLAFLLGLLVGWIIWGRRVRVLLSRVRELSAAVEAREANHGGVAELATTTEATGDASDSADERSALVAGSAGLEPATATMVATRDDAAGDSVAGDGAANGAVIGGATNGKAANGKAGRSKATGDKATNGKANGKAANGKSSNGKSANGTADSTLAAANSAANGKATSTNAADTNAADTNAADTNAVEPINAEPDAGAAEPLTETDVVATPIHIPAPRTEMTEPPIVGADPAPHETPETASVTAADNDAPVDDLVRIEGIGPKIAAALVAAGIRTFRRLADADETTLTMAINAAGITFAPSLATWSQQARLLADDDEEGFLELTERLIAGRVVTAKATAAEAVVPDPATPPDDLARIEGIGPKIAAALVASGIRTFRQMAATDDETLTKAINAVGIKFAPSLYTWAEQAHLLAEGDEEGFGVLTARLIAGRRPDDDLERIEGIGPKMAAALHAAGIRTYRALADSSDVRLRNAVTTSGMSFAPSIVTWARQARLLADGDEEGFADLTRHLIAGRDEERA
jgi:predicted flap endonuclease-1-like 5' DNA nuclease